MNMQVVSDFSGMIRKVLHKDCIFGFSVHSSHTFETKPILEPIT